MRRKSHVRFGGRAGETHRSKDGRALRSDPYSRTPGPTRGFWFYLYAVMGQVVPQIGWLESTPRKPLRSPRN